MDRTGALLFGQGPAFFAGAVVTLQVTLLAAFLGFVFGAVVFLLRIRLGGLRGKSSSIFSFVMAGVSPIVQAVPVMVLLVWVHYALPELLGVRLNAFTTSVIVLGVVSALSSASILLSAFLKIPKEEIEAAKVLGIDEATAWRKVVFPMVWRDGLPLFLGHWIELAKLSTLCSAIALPELLNTTSGIVSTTYQALPAYTALGIVFIAILLPLNLLLQRWEAALPVKR
jgi:polar amino acid transport system permease protein